MKSWNGLAVAEQEAIIGRTKMDNVELDDADNGQLSHKSLATMIWMISCGTISCSATRSKD
jgi:putative iron-dependent peroxidase